MSHGIVALSWTALSCLVLWNQLSYSEEKLDSDYQIWMSSSVGATGVWPIRCSYLTEFPEEDHHRFWLRNMILFLYEETGLV